MKLPSLLRRPLAAAVLSFLFPGLGQAAAGKPSRGAIVAIPALAVLGAFFLLLIVDGHSVLNAAFDQQWLASLLILDIVALAYHLWAVVDSYLLASQAVAKPRRRGPSTRKWGATVGVAIILSGTVVVHAGVASVDLGWQNSLSCLNALSPCFAGPTLAPGQTIAMTSDNPDEQVLPSASTGASGSAGVSGATASPGLSFDPNATFDPASLPSFATSNVAANWAADGQLNVLLAGVDAGLGGGRSTGLRPDTMIVLHVDLATGRAAMIGIPRNTMCVPLPSNIAVHYTKPTNGCPAYTWPYMLNWLANEAGWNHPSNFPFYQGAGLEYTRAMTATEQAIGTLTGLTIDGFVVINLEGLVTLIDDLGGINIDVPTTVADYPCGPAGTWAAKWRVCDICGSGCAMSARIHFGYSTPDDTGAIIPHMIADAAQSGGKQTITWHQGADIAFVIKPGEQHMDGDWALAYARTRIYTTDYARMLRQQLVLKAMRNTVDPCTVLPQIPSLVNALGSAFWTDMPLSDATQWASLAKKITGGNVKSITLDPATLGVNTTYINPTTWARAKSIVAHSLDSVPAATGTGAGGGGLGC